MKIFYFSSTGNSLYVAKKVNINFENSQLVSVVNYNGDIEINDDITFVYPIHLGSVPIIMEEFLGKIKVSKKNYICAIGVSGGGSANLSFTHIERIIDRKIDSAFTVKYISNYIRAGRDASKERINISFLKNEDIILDVIEGIKNKDNGDKKRGSSLKLLGYNLWKNYYKNKDKGFNVNSKCTACGICEKVCPVNNISTCNGKIKWEGRCTDCMACINLCPRTAINIGNKTIKKGRYKHPKIKISELMY